MSLEMNLIMPLYFLTFCSIGPSVLNWFKELNSSFIFYLDVESRSLTIAHLVNFSGVLK